MRHLLATKVIFAIFFSIELLVLPQYCLEHKTDDYCWIEQMEEKGGPTHNRH